MVASIVGVLVVAIGAGAFLTLRETPPESSEGAAQPTRTGGSSAGTDASEPAVKPTMTLHQAAARGDLAQLAARLNSGSNVNSKSGPGGLTPLETAIASGQSEAVAMLLENAADPKVRNLLGQTPVEQAVEADDVPTVASLLAVPGAVAASRTDEPGLLRIAAREGAVGVATFLVGRGTAFDTADADGATPLHLAARRGHAGVVELLLAKGARTTAADKSGASPLHRAASSGHTAVVVLLLAKGADVTAKDAAGRTALHLAAVRGDADMARALIAKGADSAAPGPDGTPLAIALASGNVFAYRALTGSGGVR